MNVGKFFLLFWLKLILFLLFGFGCSVLEKEEIKNTEDWYIEQRSLYYGIPVSVLFTPRNNELAEEIWEYLNEVDNVFNDYRIDSEISIINQSSGNSEVRLSPLLVEAFEYALKLSDLTRGCI